MYCVCVRLFFSPSLFIAPVSTPDGNKNSGAKSSDRCGRVGMKTRRDTSKREKKKKGLWTLVMDPSLNSVGNSRKMCHCACVWGGALCRWWWPREGRKEEKKRAESPSSAAAAGASTTYLFIILQLQPCSLTITIIRRSATTHRAFHSDKMMTLITSRYTTEWLNAPCEQPTTQKDRKEKRK